VCKEKIEVKKERRKMKTYLYSTMKTKYQVECGLFLDVIVRESVFILKLLSSEDQTLLIRGDFFLVLNLGLTDSIVSELSTLRMMVFLSKSS
jgi:hypothetical protein